jgi:hypothetical protein
MTLNTRRGLLSLAIIYFLPACASSGLPAPPEPSVVPSTPAVMDTTPSVQPPPRLTAFRFGPGRSSYWVRQEAIVTVSRDSVLPPEEDTIATSARISYDITASDSIAMTGPRVIAIIDSFTIRAIRDTIHPIRQLPDSVVVDITRARDVPTPIPVMTDTTVTTTAADLAPSMPMVPCDQIAEAARILAQQIFPAVPATLEPGATWSDSTSTTMCRGGIPITTVTMSTYRVQDRRDSSGLQILYVHRQADLQLTGTGMQGSRQLRVEGTGQSETLLTYDLTNGHVLEQSGQSVISLVYQTLQLTHRAIQRTRSSVRLIPPG